MISRKVVLATTWILSAVLVSCLDHAHASPRTDVGSLLLEQYETVASTNSAFLLAADPDHVAGTDSEFNLRLPFLEMMGGLRTLNPQAEAIIERNYRTVVVGAKSFASPQHIGVVSSRKCYVALLSSGEQPNLASDFHGAKVQNLDGTTEWSWSAPPYEGYPNVTQFFAAQLPASPIAGPIFVMSNNEGDFRRAFAALRASRPPASQDASLIDWKMLDGYSYWAARTVHAAQVDTRASGAIPGVRDIIFLANPDKRQSFVRVLSSSDNSTTPPRLFSESARASLQSVGSGVWVAIVPMSKDQTGDDLLTSVFASLGFGVFV